MILNRFVSFPFSLYNNIINKEKKADFFSLIYNIGKIKQFRNVFFWRFSASVFSLRGRKKKRRFSRKLWKAFKRLIRRKSRLLNINNNFLLRKYFYKRGYMFLLTRMLFRLRRDISRYFFRNKIRKLTKYIFALKSSFSLSVYNLSRYILLKCRNFKRSRRHIRKFFKKVKKKYKNFLLGARVIGNGRFSRRQRASSFRFYHGATPAGSVSSNLVYSQFNFPYKYGTSSIKIFLNYRPFKSENLHLYYLKNLQYEFLFLKVANLSFLNFSFLAIILERL